MDDPRDGTVVDYSEYAKLEARVKELQGMYDHLQKSHSQAIAEAATARTAAANARHAESRVIAKLLRLANELMGGSDA